MPRRETIGWTADDGSSHDLIVTYVDDSPQRAEAVSFFSNLTQPILPAVYLPEEIRGMSQRDAQRYLDNNPLEERWLMLRIRPQDDVADDDLARLRFIPELKVLFLHGVGDNALQHVVHLRCLDSLVVDSGKVTDRCLKYVRSLSSLCNIDFSGAQRISRSAFADLVAALPNLVHVLPPADE